MKLAEMPICANKDMLCHDIPLIVILDHSVRQALGPSLMLFHEGIKRRPFTSLDPLCRLSLDPPVHAPVPLSSQRVIASGSVRLDVLHAPFIGEKWTFFEFFWRIPPAPLRWPLSLILPEVTTVAVWGLRPAQGRFAPLPAERDRSSPPAATHAVADSLPGRAIQCVSAVLSIHHVTTPVQFN